MTLMSISRRDLWYQEKSNLGQFLVQLSYGLKKLNEGKGLPGSQWNLIEVLIL